MAGKRMEDEGQRNDCRDRIQSSCSSLLTTVNAAGVEFLHVDDDSSCRLGMPSWEESEESRVRRARQEMQVFRSLDTAGTAIVMHSNAPELHAWETQLEQAGYEVLNHRVGEIGVLHLFFRDSVSPWLGLDVLDSAAEEIERVLQR